MSKAFTRACQHVKTKNLQGTSSPHAAQAVDEASERSKFEAVCARKGFALDRLPSGDYLIPAVRFAWDGWQERAALAAPAQSEQEPVGYVSAAGLTAAMRGSTALFATSPRTIYQIPLYAAPVRAVRLPYPITAFAVEMIRGSYEGGSFDAGEIQDMAVKHGLLHIEEREEPCRSEGCACAEYGFPSECYRHTEVMKDAVAQLNQSPNQKEVTE